MTTPFISLKPGSPSWHHFLPPLHATHHHILFVLFILPQRHFVLLFHWVQALLLPHALPTSLLRSPGFQATLSLAASMIHKPYHNLEGLVWPNPCSLLYSTSCLFPLRDNTPTTQVYVIPCKCQDVLTLGLCTPFPLVLPYSFSKCQPNVISSKTSSLTLPPIKTCFSCPSFHCTLC